MTGEAGINYLKTPIGGDAATADKQKMATQWNPIPLLANAELLTVFSVRRAIALSSLCECLSISEISAHRFCC